MRIGYLKIHRFKNLNGFEVDFDEACEEPVTVILGRNGSGKSNLFEALVIIFRDLIQGKSTSEFGYDLRYTLQGGSVTVNISNPPIFDTASSSPQQQFASKDGIPITAFAFIVTKDGRERRITRREIWQYLPRYVVTYYSGVSNRLEHYFFQPQLEFRDELLREMLSRFVPYFTRSRYIHTLPYWHFL